MMRLYKIQREFVRYNEESWDSPLVIPLLPSYKNKYLTYVCIITVTLLQIYRDERHDLECLGPSCRQAFAEQFDMLSAFHGTE